MKSKLLKSMVLASTLVFWNCGDDSVASAISNYAGHSSSAGEIVQPESAGSVVPGSSDAVQQGQGGNDVNQQGGGGTQPTPESSASVTPGPESSDAATPTSAAAPESSGAAAPTSATTPESSATAPAPESSSAAAPKPESSSEKAAVESSSSEKVVESSSSEAPKPAGVFLAEGKEEEKDQLKVKYIEHTGFDGGGILAYPEQLSSDKKHAVVVWGPGGGTEPGAYGGMIHRLASHGFVVIALRESPGNASQGKPALDWLEKKNNDPNDPLYQKLDMTKVGCSGHSMGGLESEQMVIQDKRVITALLNNSGDLGHSAMASVPTDKTIGIVYGVTGMERPNAEADYNNGGVKAPACLIMMDGADWGHGSGPWGGMAATVAWMRWHLGGEDFRKADFVGASGKYINGNIIGGDGFWKGTCKNF